MALFRCGMENGGGIPFPYKVAIVQSSPWGSTFVVNTMSSNTIDFSKWASGTLKGIMYSMPQKDSYCYGGYCIQTTDETLLDWLPKAFTSQMTANASGGYEWKSGGKSPTWSISGLTYTCDGLLGAVNNNTNTIYPLWFVIYE